MPRLRASIRAARADHPRPDIDVSPVVQGLLADVNFTLSLKVEPDHEQIIQHRRLPPSPESCARSITPATDSHCQSCLVADLIRIPKGAETVVRARSCDCLPAGCNR